MTVCLFSPFLKLRACCRLQPVVITVNSVPAGPRGATPPASMLRSSKKQITAPCEDNELLQDIQTTARGQAQALSKKIDR